MPIEVLMPAKSPTMSSGNLTKWCVQEGEEISAGDVIAEIETDKAIMEIETINDGKLAKILVPEGTLDVPVGKTIAIIVEEDEKFDEANYKILSNISDTSQKSISAVDINKENTSHTLNTKTNPQNIPTIISGKKIMASPLARKLAKIDKIDLSILTGSGPKGRIIKRDIEAYLRNSSAKTINTKNATQTQDDHITKQIYAERGYIEIPHDSMRKTIAARLTLSKQTIPHFYLKISCSVDKLLKLRTELNAVAPIKDTTEKNIPAYKVSVNDFIIKGLANALRDIPAANASWTSGAILQHNVCDVGMAVAIENGLITPIVRNADQMSLIAISKETKNLINKARQKKLKPNEYEGGSSSVSNLGMFKIDDFQAVINPPQASILAVGGTKKIVKLLENDQLVNSQEICLTLSCDHRVIDGAIGAQLLKLIQENLENPLKMLAGE